MGSTTRWIDRKTSGLEEAMDLLIDKVDSDDKGKTIAWSDWQINKVFAENREILLNGRTIAYNMVSYRFEQTSMDGAQHAESMSSVKSGFIIAYKTESSLNYIIDQNSIAQKMLRKLLSYNGRNEIERNMFELSDDFFVWLINRMYKENCTIETGSDGSIMYELKIIRSFRGSVDDLQTKVSATGESVMNLISTLSFLLESNSLNKIQIDMSGTEHENISLILQSGLIDGYRVFVAGQSVNKSCGRINVSATANAVHKRMLRLVLLAFADGTYLPMLCFIKIIREGMRGFILDFLRVFAGRRMPVVIGVTRPIGSERMSVFPSARRETRNRTYHRR